VRFVMKRLCPSSSRVHNRARRARHQRIVPLLWVAALLAGPAQAQAPAGDGNLDAETLQRIQALGEQAGVGLAPGTLRVEIEPGRLDPRLRLAPCERIEPYLPPQARAWGRSRVGLRCVQGPSAWNVYLPVVVKVFAPAWVAAAPLAAGTVLEAGQLQQAEVDWAAAATPPLTDASKLVGRALARPLPAGAPVRVADLKQRQWFASGDTVQLVARGNGFSVGGEGQAMSPGIEGQTVRVRTDNGRVLSGQAVGQNRVEVQL
jgi:flagella basal body P-ring formation protein FlgA